MKAKDLIKELEKNPEATVVAIDIVSGILYEPEFELVNAGSEVEGAYETTVSETIDNDGVITANTDVIIVL